MTHEDHHEQMAQLEAERDALHNTRYGELQRLDRYSQEILAMRDARIEELEEIARSLLTEHERLTKRNRELEQWV